MRIEYGIVDQYGDKMSGSGGFKSTKVSKGKYKITFQPDFDDQPAISAIAEHAADDGDNDRHVLNMVIDKIGKDDKKKRKAEFTVLITEPDDKDGSRGSPNNNRFHFIAVADK